MPQLIVDDELMTILYTANVDEAKYYPEYKKLEILHTYNKDGMQYERIIDIWTPDIAKFRHIINHWNNVAKVDITGKMHHYTILEN